ncbi:ATP-binding protein [Corynebacterium imitans]|uniref:ATP-binding protein n=1 Tax=Corynebacterium imitans TaxID=156978 RepID=UPI00254D3AB7|nr:ATP-binding protein [Corynebacterium imitans]MDK8305447.1 ATP-binding protein [Corynebacterium imitans]MDK8636252.1 ATP-binding protein [Corynebacterium imitans]MDK8771450.1 ATP-binding protein [Corynebacterium imitans]
MSESADTDGKTVLQCIVPPQPSDRKPFRVGKGGPACIRSGDGDYELDQNEEQLLISQRGVPKHDRAPVEGASVERDLDPDLLEQYLAQERSQSRRLAQLPREDQLIRTNVVAPETGEPTVAAIYALGIHPQQFLPLNVKAHVTRGPNDPKAMRMRDREEFTGPVPDLLEAVVEWVTDHLQTTTIFTDGHGKDVPELPTLAIREIVANALVHRDLSPASMLAYTQVVKHADKLIVVNPGGLWGLTESELGNTGPRARNPVLYRMCTAVKTPKGHRVIEASATGIPAVREALHDAFLPAPYFKDRVIDFQAILTSSTMLSEEDLAWATNLPGGEVFSTEQRHALIRMRNGETLTNASYRQEFPMDSTQARAELQQLVEFGLASTSGQAGGTVYSFRQEDTPAPATPESAAPKPAQPQARVYLRSEEKITLIRKALHDAGRPLTKRELSERTGMSYGQINPTLKAMEQQGTIVFTEKQWNARNQRYALSDERGE